MSAANEGVLQQGSRDSRSSSRRGVQVITPDPSPRPLLADAILETERGARGKRAVHTGVALAFQVAIVALLLVVPLLFTQGLDLYQFSRMMLVAPLPPAAPPPPAMHAQAAAPKQTFLHAQLTAPAVVPKRISTAAVDSGTAAPTISDTAGGVPGGMGDVLGGSLSGPAPPPPPPVAVKPKGPIRIFSGMKEPTLLYSPPVVYSPIAKQARIQGTVIIEAVIDEHGNVTQMHVVSGPPLLLDSALKAVGAQRYAPTMLDGQPVAIRYNVKVEFRLS